MYNINIVGHSTRKGVIFMTSTLRLRPVMLPGIEFYNEDGSFTEETTKDYQKSLDFSKRSRSRHLSSYLKEIHGAAADYHKSIVAKNPMLRLRSQQQINQARAHMEVVKMRNSEIASIEEKLQNK
jgi:hypothetical protein